MASYLTKIGLQHFSRTYRFYHYTSTTAKCHRRIYPNCSFRMTDTCLIYSTYNCFFCNLLLMPSLIFLPYVTCEKFLVSAILKCFMTIMGFGRFRPNLTMKLPNRCIMACNYVFFCCILFPKLNGILPP